MVTGDFKTQKLNTTSSNPSLGVYLEISKNSPKKTAENNVIF